MSNKINATQLRNLIMEVLNEEAHEEGKHNELDEMDAAMPMSKGDAERLPVGTRVTHPEWGAGEVVGHGDHEFDHLVRWDKLPNRDRLAHRFQLIPESVSNDDLNESADLARWRKLAGILVD
jgi:hypothetical protein